MTQARLILVLLTMAAATSPSAAASDHYPISPSVVAETMGRSGIQVSPDQITFSTGVVATSLSPALKVRSVQKLDTDRLRARLECVNSDECLPFYVDVHVGQWSAAQIAAFAARESPSVPLAQPGSSALAVRSGSRVTLMLDGDHVHIRIPVICLQGGAPGQMIRVTDTNHRLIYLAQVFDTSLVKGRLK